MHCLLNYWSCFSFNAEVERFISGGTPFQRTNPPYTDLEALPDPLLANSESSALVRILPNSPLIEAARQASPEAEEAIPEAVGKELTDSTLKWYFFHYSAEMVSLYFLSYANSFAILNMFMTLFESGCSLEFKIRTSVSILSEKTIVVSVLISSEFRVNPKESLIGKINSSLLLPQYLIQAMFGEDLYFALNSIYLIILWTHN